MLHEFILLAIAHLFAVASPGADFAVVIKNTLAAGHRQGTFTAIGVGTGILVHVLYTLFGVAVLVATSETIFSIVKIGGALYLLWLAWQALHARAQKASTQVNQQHISLSHFQAFRQGFLTNVLNPKVTIFFVALLTNIVSFDTPLVIQSLYGIWLAVYTMIWFSLVAWLFSRPKVLSWYESHGHYIDWGMGGFLLFVAGKLLLSSL